MSEHRTNTRRSRHSYREAIRVAILDRIKLGKPLNHRAILDDAGGGSATTVAEELAKAQEVTPATLVGSGATSPTQRIAALEDALNASLRRQNVLEAENQVLNKALAAARTDVDKLLAAHQDSQRLLLQGVDDLRQMVKAGQGALPHGLIETATKKVASVETGDAILWKAKHDQLLQRFVVLDARNRKLVSQLHELGVDAY